MLFMIYVIIVSSIHLSSSYFLPYVDAREFDFWMTGVCHFVW